MNAIDHPFTKVINGTTQFVIPVFQRDYSWTEEQCGQLWEDVLRVGRGPADGRHFIGSLVYVASGDSSAAFTRWLLIDGQQRMTTLVLLLLALRQHLAESGWRGASEDAPTVRRIEAYFLKNIEEEGDRAQKLILRRHDQETLRALLDGNSPPAEASTRILENYEFFLERIGEADPATVYTGIGRLVVVDVTLDAHDDPQMIFESLNSTGLDLTQADLIRNFILMRQPEPVQTRLYETYWRKIEDLFRGSVRTFDVFARDYMALKTQASKQFRADVIYDEFRDFFRGMEREPGLESALKEILRFAGYHAAFTLGRDAPDRLAGPFAKLNGLAEVAAILVMRLSDLHHRARTLSEDAFIEALELLESYVFRRAVSGLQTRGYWQIFATLAYRLDGEAPLKSLKVGLHRLREAARFPGDEEFARDLDRRDVYAMRTCHYMLDRVENSSNKEPTDTSGYTVEHVLPQNEDLPRAWRDMLGPEWRAVQQAWVHRLGNVTLTGYNSTYSDRPFEEKKTIPGGFAESSVRLNKWIREQQTWTQNEIERRGQILVGQALKVWRPLAVDPADVKAAEQDNLRQRAARRSVDDVPMSEVAKALFETLQPRIRELAGDIIETAEAQSIVYYAGDGDFFLEVLPRKHRLVLLLNLDFSECDATDEQVADATNHKFFVHANHQGGAYYRVKTALDVAGAMRLVRKAHELAAV